MEVKTPEIEMQQVIRLNLENNNITTLETLSQLPDMYSNLRIEIKLLGNPLICDCVMSDFMQNNFLLYDIHEQVSSWQCVWPHELKQKPIQEVRENQWMHKEEPENCPAKCVCRKRCSDESIVVNCKGKSLAKVPSSIPQGLLELDLRNNEITDIPPYQYLLNVTVLKLSNNKIEELQGSTLKKLKHIETLLIDSNQLTSLPREIETIMPLQNQMDEALATEKQAPNKQF